MQRLLTGVQPNVAQEPIRSIVGRGSNHLLAAVMVSVSPQSFCCLLGQRGHYHIHSDGRHCSDLPVVPPGQEEICSPRCIHSAGHRCFCIRRGVRGCLLDFSHKFTLGLLRFQDEHSVDPGGMRDGNMEWAREEQVDS
jgi:hypothetical protein